MKTARGYVVGSGVGGRDPDAGRCPVCSDPVRIHNAIGCVRANCECVLTRDELSTQKDAADAPAAAPATEAQTTPPAPPAAAPAPADQPRREPALAVSRTTTAPATITFSGPVEPVDLTDLPAAVGASPAAGPGPAGDATPAGPSTHTPRRQDPRPASGARDGGDDADQVVPAETLPAGTTYLDPDLLFAHALYVSVRWYCAGCHEWPLIGGACLGCGQPLQAVYHATIPRELT